MSLRLVAQLPIPMIVLKCAAGVLFGLVMNTSAQLSDLPSGRRLGDAPLTVPGAKVETEAQAESAALSTFIKAQHRAAGGLSAMESAQVNSVLTLGFDLDGFANRGDKVWDTTIQDLTKGITAVIWVHAQTGRTRILVSR